jgi:hypothetical protein
MRSEQRTDLVNMTLIHRDLREKKENALLAKAYGMMDFDQYNETLAEIDRQMNANQFRYINKYKVKDKSLATKVFVLTPDDLDFAKINYN